MSRKYRIKEITNRGGKTHFQIQVLYFMLFWGNLTHNVMSSDIYRHSTLKDAQKHIDKLLDLENVKHKYHY